ncbi:MAG: ATP-binding protein [Planctomycetota bacterium]
MTQTPELELSDLTICDEEPIHLPGAVQPHGCLLGVSGDGRVIAHADNASQWFGASAAILGAPIEDLFDDAVATLIREHARPLNGLVSRVHRVPFGLGLAPMVLHTNDQGVRIVELLSEADLVSESALDSLHTANNRVLGEVTGPLVLQQFLELVVSEVQSTLEFDRVMAYQFFGDGSGEVVAEVKRQHQEPFLGLRYPATDIPHQARALYLRNHVRIITDIGYAPSALHVDTQALSDELDLSHALLRSVSPVHREYLANMGVTATCTISIILEGELWGLIACHHSSPHEIPAEALPMLIMLGQTVSAGIGARLERRKLRAQLEGTQVTQFLLNRLNATSSMSKALTAGSPNIRDLVACDGATIVFQGEMHQIGQVPSVDAFELLHQRLDELAASLSDSETHPILAIDRGLGPGWDPEMPGILAFRFSQNPSDFVAWHRCELISDITWAGKPEKSFELNGDDSVRLSPRKSFAAWVETVSGTSASWLSDHIAAAATLQQGLREVVLRISMLSDEVDQRKRTEARLREVIRDVEAFAHAASHDLRQPARNMSIRLSMLEQQLGQLDDATRKHLERAVAGSQEMHRLIDGMNALATASTNTLRVHEIDLESILTSIEDDLEDLMHETGATLERGPLAPIAGDRDLIKRVLLNLIENAIKYRDAERAPVVNVSTTRANSDQWTLTVRDNGRGITADEAEHLVDAFARGSADPSIQGTGLGLAICRRIAQRHNGDITLAPAPDAGCIVTVTGAPVRE